MKEDEAPAKRRGPGVPGALFGILGFLSFLMSYKMATINVVGGGINYGIVITVAGILIGAVLTGASLYLYATRRRFLSLHHWAVVGVYFTIVLFLALASAVSAILIILSFAHQVNFL